MVRLLAVAVVGVVVFIVLSALAPRLGEPHRIGIAWGTALAAVLFVVERLRGRDLADSGSP
jgi:hypothetical protein